MNGAMVVQLIVENIAIIERSELNLGPGFTVLTGETGAGKSLLIDSIGLALGDRADSTLVRTGASRGSVAADVEISSNPHALEYCLSLGIDVRNGRLRIARDVSAEGRSSCRIGERPASVSVLKTLGGFLVDLHGQHDHQQLLNSESHLLTYDLWIGSEAMALRERCDNEFREVEATKHRLTQFRRGQRDRDFRIQRLQTQIEETRAVNPRLGELAELESQIARLQHVEQLRDLATRAHELLSAGEGSALEKAQLALQHMDSGVRLDPALEEDAEALRSALYGLEDASTLVREYLGRLDDDPDALQLARDRREEVVRLVRKYGDSEIAVLEGLTEATAELELLENGDISAESLEHDFAVAEAAFARTAQQLTATRRANAEAFSLQVERELGELAMPGAVLQVAIGSKPPGPDGVDSLEFLFSANTGEAAKPLARIASGGEVSRVMLAMKVALAGRAGVPTLIFDEADTGLSGRAAALVARKMRQLSDHYQVIAISHLPQLAGLATRHLRIEKVEQAGRVVTRVVELDGEERVREIARMLAGEEIGDSALANARELLGWVGGRSSLVS
ncbi:MAG: DNA repair protein RecN [Armatimonadetes bacterium]|nr:DNA repair protein RecN [Armatimonadota bacterium]